MINPCKEQGRLLVPSVMDNLMNPCIGEVIQRCQFGNRVSIQVARLNFLIAVRFSHRIELVAIILESDV